MNNLNEQTVNNRKSSINNESILPEINKDTSFSFNKLVKDVGRQSLKSIQYFLIVLLSVGLFNIIIFIVALFRQGNKPLSETNYGLFFILLIGLISVIFALYGTYRYLLIDTLQVVYKYLTPLFRKISVKIIDTIILGGDMLTGKHGIEKMLNIGSLMIEVYGKKLPSYLQKAIMFILRHVPFSDFLLNMQHDLRSGHKDNNKLSEMLYGQLDDYIVNTFFRNNSMKWIIWFFPLNIIIQIILLVYFK